jgi:HSP20 family protein
MTIVKRETSKAPVFTSLFDDFFTRDLFNWPGINNYATVMPKTNILENDNEIIVQMAVPGMKKEDFKVEVENGSLSISADEVEHFENGNYITKEYSYNAFRRSFSLPEMLNPDKITAKYEDGILNLVIPKKEEAKKKPAKTIKIS